MKALGMVLFATLFLASCAQPWGNTLSLQPAYVPVAMAQTFPNGCPSGSACDPALLAKANATPRWHEAACNFRDLDCLKANAGNPNLIIEASGSCSPNDKACNNRLDRDVRQADAEGRALRDGTWDPMTQAAPPPISAAQVREGNVMRQLVPGGPLVPCLGDSPWVCTAKDSDLRGAGYLP